MQVPNEPPLITDVSTACASLTVTWTPPSGAGRITHYTVLVSRGSSRGGEVMLERNVTDTRLQASTIFSGATYGVQVRAHNFKGSSRWSLRLLGTTPVPDYVPVALGAPVALASGSACDVSIMLQTGSDPGASDDAEAQKGCAAAEYAEVQALQAGTTDWKTVATRVVASVVALPELDPSTAYRFRVVARNRLGSSVPSMATSASPAVVPGLAADQLAPTANVQSTSSISYAIALPALEAECQVDFAWTVYARTIADDSTGSLPWSVLASAGQGSTYEAELRCPAGCEFRLQPEVQLFAQQPPAGPVTRTQRPALPAKPPAAARVELWLRGDEWNRWMRDELEEAFVRMLHLPRPPVFVETHTGATRVFLIVDLLEVNEEAATEAARRLVHMISALNRDGAGGVTGRLEAEVRLLVDDRWELVDARASAPGRHSTLPAMVSRLAFGAAGVVATAYACLSWPSRPQRQGFHKAPTTEDV